MYRMRIKPNFQCRKPYEMIYIVFIDCYYMLGVELLPCEMNVQKRNCLISFELDIERKHIIHNIVCLFYIYMCFPNNILYKRRN